jgi:hypothetical protein
LAGVLLGNSTLTDDTLNQLNLLMLLGKKTSTDPATKEKIKKYTEAITDKLAASADISNGSVLFGDNMYSGQVYMSGDDISKSAIANRLPIYNMTECEDKLRDAYNLPRNTTIIYITSATDGAFAETNSTAYGITAYASDTKEKLNLDYCEDVKNNVQLPLPENFDVNMTLYNELKEQGIDMFNPDDPVFHDICIPYTDNSTNSDTTLNWRRQNLYSQKKPMCIGFNCTYQGINEFNYLKCECSGIDTGSNVIDMFAENLLDSLSGINIGIVTCYKQIPTVSIYLKIACLSNKSGVIYEYTVLNNGCPDRSSLSL